MALRLHARVIASMRWHADEVAVVNEEGRMWTYGELARDAVAWSVELGARKQPRRENPFVGVLAPVTAGSIAAVIGALAAGFAYVPLDEQSPTDRLLGVIERTGMDVIIADPAYLARHSGLASAPGVKHVLLTNEPPRRDGVFPNVPVLGEDLAYVLHSSGSTGIPKGIMLTHRNACTFTEWMQGEFRLAPFDVVMSRAPWKFDLSVFDVFNTLAAGARLVVFDWTHKRDAVTRHRDYVSLMAREGATVLYTTPSTLIALMNRGGLAEAMPPLRTVMYAGEPFPTAQLRRLRDALHYGARIANLYGPTETNVITCQWVDELPADDSPVPLGRVVDDTEIIVVSEDGRRLCGPDEVGELWCRGGTVTAGYLGMPEKTAEHYVLSPFHGAPARFWRTGDFGFRDAGGVLHYRGRRDHMVKVRGYRVELGEIEAALAGHPDLDEVAVVAVADAHNGTGSVLACYFTALLGRSVSAAEVRAFLAGKVPEYMVPRLVEGRAALPATSSGKIDRITLERDAAAGAVGG